MKRERNYTFGEWRLLGDGGGAGLGGASGGQGRRDSDASSGKPGIRTCFCVVGLMMIS